MLEDLTALYLEIGEKVREVQKAAQCGDHTVTLILAADVRELAAKGVLKIGKARQGIYDS